MSTPAQAVPVAPPTVNKNEFVQTDMQLERNRGGRVMVAVGSAIALPVLAYFTIVSIGDFFRVNAILAQYSGNMAAFATFIWIIYRSWISNGKDVALITINPVASFLNKDPFVYYGPGDHACYWFEKRSRDGVVPLGEVSVRIEFESQGKGGTFHSFGASRYRPDINRLMAYKNGAATVSSELRGLIIPKISHRLSTEQVETGITLAPVINQELESTFKLDVSPVEERMGIIFGDVTMERIVPSNEVKKAMDGAAEMRAMMSFMVPMSLGYPTMEAMNQAVADGKLSSDAVINATKVAMTITDNLHGMKLNETTFNLNLDGLGDLDPESAKALGAALPAVTAFIAGRLGKGGGDQKGGKQQSRRPQQQGGTK